MNEKNEKSDKIRDRRDDERKQILLYALQREDALVNNRLVWVLTMQGFLFAAVALSLEKDVDLNLFYANILGCLGLGLSIMGAFLSWWSNSSIKCIRKKWGDIESTLDDVSPFGSDGHASDAKTNHFGLSVFLPVSTGLAWALILYYINGR